jgi:hypothetical protein
LHVFVYLLYKYILLKKSISHLNSNQICPFFYENEQKLITAALYAEKYAQLLEVFEQQDPNQVLSLDQLQQFVDARNKYFEKVTTRRNALTSIIETVTEIAAKGLKEEEIPADGTPSNNIKVSF